MRGIAGFLYGLDLHHLDHIAPLCSLLGIPLLCTDELPKTLATHFYPDLEVQLYPDTESIVAHHDTLFTCLPKPLFDQIFFFDEHKQKKKLFSIWLPHGNSDKDNLGGLSQEKLILTYGKQMETILKDKKIFAPTFPIGHFRKTFFEKHRTFYNKLLTKRISFSSGKTILYAPTWNHSDVVADLPLLLKNLPPNYNLLVKLHPNTLNKLPHLPEQYPDIPFISDIPTIFPILDKTDILITDTSSIAYDFLAFDRPLYFFTSDRTPIHRTGYITSPKTLPKDLERPDIFDDARKELYSYTFHKSFPQDLLSQVKTHIESEINLL